MPTSTGLKSACHTVRCDSKCELCCKDYCNHPGGNKSWAGLSKEARDDGGVMKEPGCDDIVPTTTKGPDGVSKGPEGGSNGSNNNVGSGMLMMVFIMIVTKKLYSLVIMGFEDF